MNLTPEILKQNAAAGVAMSNGNPIEYRLAGSNNRWLNYSPDSMAAPDWGSWEYRPKPEPVSRPWSKPDDVPGPVCWIRRDHWERLIIMVNPSRITFVGGVASKLEDINWDEIQRDGCEYSTDRKTWHKCEVRE